MTVATILLAAAPSTVVPPLEPTWTSRDTQLIIDRLDLAEPDSAEIVWALLKDYETQWIIAREQLRGRTTRDTPEEVAIDAVQAFQTTQRRLADVLTTDIDLILIDPQRPLWQRLQNEMWRLRRLRHGRLTGESFDLPAFVEGFPLLPSEADPARLVQWEAAVATLLAEREPFDIEGPSRFRYLVMEGRNEEAWRYLDEWVRLRLAIRDLTLQAVEDVAASMTPERQTAFRAAIAEQVFPYRARRRRIDQLVRHIRRDDAIGANTLTAVEAIYAEYLAVVAPLERSRQQIERELEPATMRSQMQRRTGRQSEVPRLQQAQLENELAFRQKADEYLKQMCAVVESPLCHRPEPAAPKKPAPPPPPIPHPSGLPLGETPAGGPDEPDGVSPLPAEPPNPNPQSPFPDA